MGRYNLPLIDGTNSVKIPRDFNALSKAIDTVLEREIDKLFSATTGLASGSPKGAFNTVNDLVQAIPGGDSNIYVILEDGKWYFFSNGVWKPGNVYQGTALADKSVKWYQTDFLKQNSNLFNKNDVMFGKYYSPTGVLTTNASYNAPNLIRVKSGTTYSLNVSLGSTVALFDSNKNWMNTIGGGTWTNTFTVPPGNHAYLSFAIPVTTNLDTLMMVEGTIIPTQYIPFGFMLDELIDVPNSVKQSFLTKSNLTIGIIGKNLFDKSIVTGYEVYGDGSFRTEANSARTNYIAVGGATNIYLSGMTPYATGLDRYLYFYTASKTPIGTTAIKLDRQLSEASVPVPANAEYVVFSVYQRKTSAEVISLDVLQVEKGISKSTYEPLKTGVRKIDGYELGVSTPPTSTTTEPLKTAGKKMLLFGDSITETATVSDDGATYTEGTRTNWGTFTKVDLQVGEFWNYAKSGAAYRDRTGVLERQKISVQINTAIANNRPGDIIVVACGTNDGIVDLGDYATAMGKATLNDLDRTKLYEAIRWAFWKLRTAYPNAVCFAGLPLQRADIEPPEELLTAITKMAKRYNFHLIDGTYQSNIIREFEVNGGDGRYLYDGLHPKTVGAKEMSKLYTRRILETYK